MDRADFFDRLDEELRTDAYADVDASPNGLQVGRRVGDVETVAFAVDAAAATIEAAVDVGADALVTHHGLVWGGLDRVTGREYDRIEPLVTNDLPLYVSHLPLDGHPTLGNAAGVADLLDLDDREPFGEIGPETVGLLGERGEPISLGALSELLGDVLDTGTEGLDTGAEGVQTLAFGPDDVERVAVLTGSGVDWLDEAVDSGADALVTGEGKQKVYHEAKEAEINVLLAGHYATETFGVRSLQALAEEWGLETIFVDHPTGL
ncbi:MAG: Nif3-like dinuclear metal center hexameric protein [Halolamina sp.]